MRTMVSFLYWILKLKSAIPVRRLPERLSRLRAKSKPMLFGKPSLRSFVARLLYSNTD